MTENSVDRNKSLPADSAAAGAELSIFETTAQLLDPATVLQNLPKDKVLILDAVRELLSGFGSGSMDKVTQKQNLSVRLSAIGCTLRSASLFFGKNNLEIFYHLSPVLLL